MPTLEANAVDSARVSGADDTTFGFGDIGIDGTASYQHGWLHFNLSSIPASAIVTAVTLKMYHYNTVRPYADASFVVRRSLGSWVYTTIKRSNEPTQDTTALASLLIPASVSNGILTWTFDAYGIARVQDMVSGAAANYGFMVRLANESDNAEHNFNDHTEGNPPKLSVTYRVNGAAPVVVFF